MAVEKRGFLSRTAESLGFTQPQTIETRDVNGPAAGVIPPALTDSTFITPDVALQIGAVHRAIFIITASVSQMELGVYRNGEELRTPLIVGSPSIEQSQKAFLEETVFSLAAYGNAYWRLHRDYTKAEHPIQHIEVLDPSSVSIVRNERGVKEYWFGDTRLQPENVKHLRLFRRPGHDKGYGPIQHGQSELLGALRLRAFADEWFGRGIPTGMLTTDQRLNAADAEAYIEAWKNFVKTNGTALLQQGMQYEHLNIKPSEAQFLEVQQASVVGIARLFGVPAMHLLAELTGTSNTYLNLEQANIVFLQTTLVKYMNEIEEAFSSLLPRGQRVQFKEEGLLRMDSAAKWSVIKTQVEVGYTNGNELRALEGKAPLPQPKPVAKPNENEDEEA